MTCCRRQPGREDVLERDEQAVEVPLLDVVAGRVLVDEAADDRGDLLARGLAHVAALEHVVAVLVDDPPLLVHDVVVLEHALADEEVLLLDLPLGLLDLLGEHPGLDRLLVALLVDGPEAVEDLVDPVAGEQAHEVVLGGEEEARLARVALAAGAAAQLVVDAPRLVALGADDEQAAGLHDLSRVLLDALLDARAGRRRSARRSRGRRACRPSFASSSWVRCSGLPPSLMSTPRPAMFVAIVTAPGWPASATISPSRSAYSGLALRTVCLMPRLRQLLAEQLGDLDRDRADEDRLAALVALRRSR